MKTKLILVNHKNKKQKTIKEEHLESAKKIALNNENYYLIVDSEDSKQLVSKSFNYVFNKKNGEYLQYGKDIYDPAIRCPYGPVIADIEITSKCKGSGASIGLSNLCGFCYKSNTPKGHNMTLSEYKEVFKKIPNTITQIAFGADSDLSVNEDTFKILKYTRDNGVIPNITIADITDETAKELAKYVGGVAVSWYGSFSDKNLCYNSIDLLHKNNVKQINIHFMLSEETHKYVDELIEDIKKDERLKPLRAVVFLSLKAKGRGENFQNLSQKKYDEVVRKMEHNQINYGFDSCSQVKFIDSIKDNKKREIYSSISEPCESMKTSIYINQHGDVFPCSFMENVNWNSLNYFEKNPKFSLLDNTINDKFQFTEKIWNHDKSIQFGVKASNCNSCGEGCQYYKI